MRNGKRRGGRLEVSLSRRGPITPAGGRPRRKSGTSGADGVGRRSARKGDVHKAEGQSGFKYPKKRADTVRDGIVREMRRMWGGATRKYGLGICLAVGECQANAGVLTVGRLAEFRARPAEQPKAAFLNAADPARVARMLSGLAHPDRFRLAGVILTGGQTHRDLSTATKLKTGPLYHHIRELERAGLLQTSTRNVHELTDLGRMLLQIAVLLGTWVGKNRSPWRSVPIKPR